MNFIQKLKTENADLKDKIEFANSELKTINNFLVGVSSDQKFVVSIGEIKPFLKRIEVALKS